MSEITIVIQKIKQFYKIMFVSLKDILRYSKVQPHLTWRSKKCKYSFSIFPFILTQWRSSLSTEAFQGGERWLGGQVHTNSLLLIKGCKSLPSIQTTTFWKERKDHRREGDFYLSEVTTTASKFKCPCKRTNSSHREVLASTPGLGG